MAGSSTWRRCSDEELQKAISDIDELVARRPVPDELKDELKFLGPAEEEEKKSDDKKKKKKLYVIPPKDVEMLLSYQCEEFPETKTIDRLAKEKGGDYEDLKTAVTTLQVCGRHYQDGIRAAQEKIRHQLLTQGYVTYEATDDEEEEEEEAAPAAARGRRRQRPGVTKTAGGRVRKAN